MKKFPFLILFALSSMLVFTACEEDDDVPPEENEEEIITDVVLTFTPQSEGDIVTARAEDPDAEGPNDLEVVDDIVLNINTTYVLSIELENSIENESITDEVNEEADEHMFFFGWTEGLFATPEGDGNIDNRSDEVTYNDEDDAGLPLGLETTWITEDAASGEFRIVLKHQPGSKSSTSTEDDGETDLDLNWDLSIE